LEEIDALKQRDIQLRRQQETDGRYYTVSEKKTETLHTALTIKCLILSECNEVMLQQLPVLS